MPVALYSLDVILAVGFRVKSPRGTQFRRWANTTLKEYLKKGFVMDDERLKNPDARPIPYDRLPAERSHRFRIVGHISHNSWCLLPYSSV